ncbi:MAG: hypothetical protein JW942_01455 [Opitutales bacterium]|nr:hypothetical protein [Opitutales bacterium]
MKDYLAGILVIVLAIFLLGKVTLSQVNKVNAIRTQLSTAQADLARSTLNSNNKNTQIRAQFGNDDVALFMSQNGATLQSMVEIGTINQRIGSESESLRIPIQEQKTNALTLPGRQGTVISQVETHDYSLAILSTFRDSLVWMGKIQDAFPYARVVSVTYTPSGDFVNLKARVLFPKMNTSVISNN